MGDDSFKVSRLREALSCDSSEEYFSPVTGETVTIGNNNHVTVNKFLVMTSAEELTPAQKLRLSELVGSVVNVSAGAGRPVAYQTVWRRFQKHFQVNSYHALPADKFSSAEAFLKMLYARAKKGDL